MQKLTYRPDIDGLRALAILPVLWFHSDLPGLSGGFTGVDTFFVISGFLITGIIYREISEGHFSFLQFYERRARRIGPALLAVIFATLAVGSLLLLPGELIKLAESSIAALAMVPNIYFWQEAGYFRLGESITPLLHFWSLGVEEQFYIFFPIMLIIAHRLRAVRSVLFLLFSGSFVLSVIGTIYAPSASFYLLPTRAFEMALGGILAIGLIKIPRHLHQVAGWLGLALLAGSAVFISKQTLFPGWVAIIPCLGAGMIIASSENTIVGRMLAQPFLVWIGKISYSLYLWHWPIFVYLRHYNANLELSPFLSVVGIALSFVLAWLTYILIEQPARGKTISFRKVGLRLAGAVALCLAVSLTVIGANGFPDRHTEETLLLYTQSQDHGEFAKPCVTVPLEQASARCQIGAGKAKIVIWGDSHAAAMIEGVQGAFDAPTVALSKNSCAPTLGWTNHTLSKREKDSCNKRNKDVFDYIAARPDVSTVVLAAYWPSHYRAGGDQLWEATQAAASRLSRLGKNVVILAGTPEPGENVPWATAIRHRFDREQRQLECPSAIIPITGASIVDLSEAYCSHPAPEMLFTDNNHPSLTANTQIIAPALRANFETKR